MSVSQTGRNIIYKLKVGDVNVVSAKIVNVDNSTKDLSNTTTYSTAKWKVWKPDGTLLMNGAMTYNDRPNGVVTYNLQTSDTVAANVGVWDGEVELYDNSGALSEQTETFSVWIIDSF